ncbi:hypothetical protein CbuD7D7780_11750 (plasmid) [Coxiella burnetii]|uniref:Uncharacterized protein n=1 Tax=Coxiella burnetii (strain Dugway 5J108-111) TaxID=434922 RepID=A9KH55_COXBN|nr:hypothetical protein [Coxiella burnetii]ABS78544.2 hypothetical protein CBUD_A0026 [Coxiella burnetii Dugway 5J108-111]OYK81239.1 hypothetical protein CbuD7D7780_11750 [Coxiella burnetii]
MKKKTNSSPPVLPNANGLFQVPRLDEMILTTLRMERLNELIACNNTSPLWTQYKLTPDLQDRLRNIYMPVVAKYLGQLIGRDGKQNEAEALIKVNPALLLARVEIETHSKGLKPNDKPVVLEGTAFQLAARVTEDDKMAAMIAKYLDEYYPYVDADHPGEKLKQDQDWLAANAANETKREQQDIAALDKMFNAIQNADDKVCERVLNEEETIIADDKEAEPLLKALNDFRNYLIPKEVVTGKQFNIQLLIQAFQFYDKNYETFGGFNSPKNNLCWRKVIGFMQRFLPAHYAQAFAQGTYYIVVNGEEVCRRFDFRYGDGSYFPLDSDPNFRMGYNCGMAGGSGFVGGRRVGLFDGFKDCWTMRLESLCQAKTVALQGIMQQPCNQSQSKRLVM